MLWNTGRPFDLPSHAERARQAHSMWLTWALEADVEFPRIPTQAVRDGGYEELVTTTRGRRICIRWWRRALSAIERLTPPALKDDG